jgi:hypothetical protein
MISSGFGSDTVKSVGWTWNAAKSQNIVTKGTLKVYILNTTDTAYNKGTNFSTAITGMTKIIDDSIMIPAGLGPFNVTVPVGGPGTSSFITNGIDGVYLAFEYKTTSTLASVSGSPTVSCNNSLTNRGGTYQSQSANGTTLTLSAFAPETIFGNTKLDSVDVKVLYCLGSIPSAFACNDTLGIRVKKNYATSYNVELKIRRTDSLYNTLDSAFIYLPGTGIYDTLIYYKLPCTPISIFGLIYRHERVIVEALSGDLDDKSRVPPVTIYDKLENCQNTTYDFYNYADPCVSDNGGIGINNSSGNIVARFNNYSSNVLPLAAVEHVFYNNISGGNQSYKIVVYGDNGSGKPGTILYSSSNLTSPAGTGFSQKVQHILTSSVNLPASSRFYVGIRQNNTTNIGFGAQNEIPVRSKAFFYSYPDTSNTWTDFSTAGANYKLDIAPIIGVIASSGTLSEGFSNVSFPPSGWAVEFTGTNYWSRNSVSSYGVGAGSAKFSYFTAPATTVQSIVTATFPATVADYYLKFDIAYAPYGNTAFTDSLRIEYSTNSGANYSIMNRFYGNSAGGTMNTAPATNSSFTPASTQWLTKSFPLPVGTNRIRFKAISGFGNNLYLDSISVFEPVFTSQIKVFIQGLYDSGTNTMISDSAKIYLRNIISPFAIVDSAKSLLSSSGEGNFIFKNASTGIYYLQIKHRNALETWSKTGGDSLKTGTIFSYNFADSITKSYGSNMIQVDASPVGYAIYSGDVNQDQAIDASDLAMVENDVSLSLSGYVPSDLNGDDFVDAADLSIVENNVSIGIFTITP